MNLRIIYIILLSSFAEISFSQNTPCVDSSTVFQLSAGSSKISVRQTIPLADGGIFMCGTIKDNMQAIPSIFITRFDKFNNILYNKKIIDFTGSTKIIQCNNGDILLAVAAYNTSNYTITPYLFRISISGNILWQKQLPVISFWGPFAGITGSIQVTENGSNNFFLGIVYAVETNPAQGVLSSYYFIYKITPAGAIAWKTTLIQDESSGPYINAIAEFSGKVMIVTQQYGSDNNVYCNSTNGKSVGLIKLNENDGSYFSSKNYCLNFPNPGCISSWDGIINSVHILPDGRITISGNIALCNFFHSSFSIITDPDFSIPQSNVYDFEMPGSTSSAIVSTNQFGETILTKSDLNNQDFLYAIFSVDGNIRSQRKTTFGFGKPVFKDTANYLLFSVQTVANQDFIKIAEVKGNSNETANCIGRDTSFVTRQPHTIVPISFTWDTIRTQTEITNNTNYNLADFTFQRTEVCSSVSICDSLKISGAGSVCLNNPEQLFVATRNPGCNKVPLWKIDTSAIFSMQPQDDDTSVAIKFKRPWEGYLYAYSNACGNLLDSFYIKVVGAPGSINLGRDTSFCSPVVLDAGGNFIHYQWQDSSTDRYFSVTGPGMYYVLAKDFCGNEYRDSITFYPKKNIVALGADTCVSSYPFVLTANAGFKNYQWQDGSVNQQFSVTSPGLYYVKATNFCNETYSDSIRIYKKAQPFSLGSDTIICPGNTIPLQAPAGYRQYLWQDGSSSTVLQASKAGIYHVTVSDFCGNEISDTIIIQKPGFNFTAGSDTTICKEDKINLTASNGFNNYSWAPGYNISNTIGQTVWVNPEVTTLYTVSAEKYTGCIVKDSVLVSVKDCPQTFYMPSAFTPNGDGKNDIIKPIITGRIEKYQFEIYNRWGQLVFKSKSHSTGWDGKINGVPQDIGSFVWTCSYKFYDKPAEFKKGTFTLIR